MCRGKQQTGKINLTTEGNFGILNGYNKYLGTLEAAPIKQNTSRLRSKMSKNLETGRNCRNIWMAKTYTNN